VRNRPQFKIRWRYLSLFLQMLRATIRWNRVHIISLCVFVSANFTACHSFLGLYSFLVLGHDFTTLFITRCGISRQHFFPEPLSSATIVNFRIDLRSLFEFAVIVTSKVSLSSSGTSMCRVRNAGGFSLLTQTCTSPLNLTLAVRSTNSFID
jgi:hypothetical protein